MSFFPQGNDDIYICGIASNGLVVLQHAFSTGRNFPQALPLVQNLYIYIFFFSKDHQLFMHCNAFIISQLQI